MKEYMCRVRHRGVMYHATLPRHHRSLHKGTWHAATDQRLMGWGHFDTQAPPAAAVTGHMLMPAAGQSLGERGVPWPCCQSSSWKAARVGSAVCTKQVSRVKTQLGTWVAALGCWSAI